MDEPNEGRRPGARRPRRWAAALILASGLALGLWTWSARGGARGEGGAPAAAEATARGTAGESTLRAPEKERREASPAVSAPRAAPTYLSGTVVAPSGEPIAGASVVLARGDAPDPERAVLLETRTGADGRFGLDAPLPEGEWIAAVAARGYVDRTVSVDDGRDLLIELEPRRTELPAVTVRGRVIDQQGRTFPAFELKELVRSGAGGAITIAAEWRSHAQGPGGFELSLPTLGSRADFLVRVQGYAPALESVALGSGAPVDLGEIVLAPGSLCFGRVLDAAGRPLGGASVEPRFSGPGQAVTVETRGDDGGFEFAIDPRAEMRSLCVYAEQHAPRWIHAGDVGGSWEDLTIVMTEGAALAGRVLREGRPTPGQKVRAWLHDAGGDVRTGGQGSPWTGTAVSAEDGTYRIDGVPLGRVAVGAVAEGGKELRRVALLDVAAPDTHRRDLELGGGRDIRGAIEMPFQEGPDLFLELLAREDGGELRAVAGLEAKGGRRGSPEAFVFEDVEVVGAGAPMVLRISWAPGFFTDRELHPSGQDVDLGTYRFPTMESMREFERPGATLFPR